MRPPGPVFVRGGDVLILVLAIRESGMGEILEERLAEDTLVFGGYSAGSCMFGPRLPVFEPSEPPDVPERYPAEVITESLSIAPFSFAPRYGAETGGAWSTSETDFYKENHVLSGAVRDHQVLIVDGEHTRRGALSLSHKSASTGSNGCRDPSVLGVAHQLADMCRGSTVGSQLCRSVVIRQLMRIIAMPPDGHHLERGIAANAFKAADRRSPCWTHEGV